MPMTSNIPVLEGWVGVQVSCGNLSCLGWWNRARVVRCFLKFRFLASETVNPTTTSSNARSSLLLHPQVLRVCLNSRKMLFFRYAQSIIPSSCTRIEANTQFLQTAFSRPWSTTKSPSSSRTISRSAEL